MGLPKSANRHSNMPTSPMAFICQPWRTTTTTHYAYGPKLQYAGGGGGREERKGLHQVMSALPSDQYFV